MPVKQRARLAQVAMVALSEEVKFSPYSRRKLTSTAASNTSTAPQTRKSRKQTSEVTAETLFSDSRYRSALEKLEASYQKNGDPVKAPQMRKYMKDQFDYYGLQSPVRRKIDAEIRKSLPPDPEPKDVEQLVRACWLSPKREVQYFAQDYLASLLKCDIEKGKPAKYDPGEGFVDFLQWLLSTKAWWDTVDCLATSVLGPYLIFNPQFLPIMDDWIEHDNMWLRRSALLFQLKYKSKTDFARLERYILRTAHEEEFFIRKAIGWALRQYAYTDKKRVKEFVEQNRHLLSKLSQREALKHA